MTEFHYIIKNEEARQVVFLKGDLVNDVKPSFDAIEMQMTSVDVVFDCAKLEKLNSIAVRHWLMFLDRIAKKHTFKFRHCSESFIDTASMIPGFTRNSPIESFFTVFSCGSCSNEKSLLVTFVERQHIVPSLVVCEKCGNKMAASLELDDHLSFLAG